MFKMKKLSFMLFLALLISISVPAFSKDAIKESWYLIEQGGRPVGFSYEQYFGKDTGYSYLTNQTMKMQNAAEQIIVNQQMKAEVNEKYELEYVEILADLNNVRTKIQATFGKDKVDVVITIADNSEHKSSIPVKSPVYFSPFLFEEIISTGELKINHQYTKALWNFAVNQPVDSKISVLEKVTYDYNGKTIDAFEVKQSDQLGETTLIVDQKGQIYYSEEKAQDLVLRKVEKDQITDLQAFTVEMLMIPGNIQVSKPNDCDSSKITLIWEQVPFEEFDLQDNRQTIIENRSNAEQNEILISIQKDNRDFTGVTKLPVSDAKFAPYLTDTEFIHVNLPEVQQLVSSIVGSEKDGWIVTQKLVNWVYNYLEYSGINETLTTEQILEQHTGKCVEYAVLFASLARSIGLPTKIVFGERFVGDKWVGHIWNEVWLGEWVAVDPTYNQVKPDALLVKLVDSNKILGTQVIRHGLIGNLKINVEDYQVLDNPAQDIIFKTGIVDSIYTNIDYKCQLIVPDDWKLIETTQQNIPLVVFSPKNNTLAQGTLMLLKVPANTKPTDLLKSRIQSLKGVLPKFKLITQATTVLAKEIEAAYGTWSFVDNQGKLFIQQNWVVTYEKIGYIFVFLAEESIWKNNEPIFDDILSQFKLL